MLCPERVVRGYNLRRLWEDIILESNMKLLSQEVIRSYNMRMILAERVISG